MNDAFNYVAVPVSIVTGLAATRLMSGLSEMIQVANRPRIYWVHIVWIINLFIDLMLYWWVLYRWHTALSWTFFLFLWVTIPAILVYLASAILFPGELETTGSPTWRDYYYKNRRGFFFIFGSIAPLDIVDTLLKGAATLHRSRPALSPLHLLLGTGLPDCRNYSQRKISLHLGVALSRYLVHLRGAGADAARLTPGCQCSVT